jgi:hypothetical protein
VVSWANAVLYERIVAACTPTDTSVTHKRALETREPSCMSRAAKPFFIPVVHSPPGAVENVAAPELLSQEGRAPTYEIHDSTGAPLSGT